jgi:hypothetical protein
MKRMKSTLRLFKFLLHTYPQNFKREFGEEMLDVFKQNLMDSDNWIQISTKILREMQAWFATALLQNMLGIQDGWEDWRIKSRINSQAGSVPLDNNPGTWRRGIAGAIPILWVPLIFLSSSLFPGYVGWYWMGRFGFLALTLLPAIGFCVAWIKRFPRWSYSYLGGLTAILILSISMNDPRYDASILLFFWTPVIVTFLIALLVTRSFDPLLQLARGIWNDWTRLSFALYGSLIILLLDAYDGFHLSFDSLLELLTFAILAFGALAYLRSSKIAQRAQSLLVGFGIAWILIVSVNKIYWNGRQEVWLREPAHWQTTLLQLLVPGMILLGLLFSPIILSGLRCFSRSTKPV